MSMKCLECGERTLEGYFKIEKWVPFSKKGGTLVFPPKSNITVDAQKQLFVDHEIRGPIRCTSCGAEHFYVPGAKEPLMQGSYEEAQSFGAEAFLEEG